MELETEEDWNVGAQGMELEGKVGTHKVSGSGK